MLNMSIFNKKNERTRYIFYKKHIAPGLLLKNFSILIIKLDTLTEKEKSN